MKRLSDAILVFNIWLLLTWSLQPQDLIVGIIFSVLVGLMVGDLLDARPTRLFDPRRWFWVLAYIPYFAWNCAKANFDMAYRVLHPAMPIRPGVVRVRVNLKGEVSRAFLATSVTLMPGTHVVDVVGDRMYVHWVNVIGETEEEHTRRVVKHFEFFLGKIFE
jgi:multicomponent Na+:H+ antiporter subunit E